MNTIANTDKGRVEGIESNGVIIFKGIPYAAPPIGELRWMPPKEAGSWDGVRPAKQFSPVAPQVPGSLDAMMKKQSAEQYSEDCLYLNVYTPAVDEKKRPVMVFIHGGSFTSGSGGFPIYDGGSLVRNGDVVVVTINYRLGALGFMNLNLITNGDIPARGNEGLHDQVAALCWVKRNIGYFGGNSDAVTVFGESAGAMSIGALLAMPSARGLFHRAILQSGACHTAISCRRSEQVASEMIALLNIECTVDALRALPAEKLLEAQEIFINTVSVKKGLGAMPFQPVIDGEVLPKLPIQAVQKGEADKISILAGSNLHEWKFFGAFNQKTIHLREDKMKRALSRRLPDVSLEEILETYENMLKQNSITPTPGELFMAVETDRVYRIPALRLLEAQAEHQPKAYNYFFDWCSPLGNGFLGSCHTLELGFVFGSYHHKGLDIFFGTGAAADRLCREVQNAWITFARTGELDGIQPYNKENRFTMIFGENSRVVEKSYETERRIWDNLPDTMIGTL